MTRHVVSSAYSLLKSLFNFISSFINSYFLLYVHKVLLNFYDLVFLSCYPILYKLVNSTGFLILKTKILIKLLTSKPGNKTVKTMIKNSGLPVFLIPVYALISVNFHIYVLISFCINHKLKN